MIISDYEIWIYGFLKQKKQGADDMALECMMLQISWNTHIWKLMKFSKLTLKN